MVSSIPIKIDISIIIINYNSVELIEKCLSSFEKFAYGFSYEIIIVDNSNDKELPKVLQDYNNTLLLVNEENKGFGAANNQGLKIARGKYILFLNNDTLFIENSVLKILNYLKSIDHPTILGCKLLNEDLSLQYSVLDFPNLLNTFTSNFFLYIIFPKSKYFNKYHFMNKKIKKTQEVDIITGAFLFSKTSDILKLNGFDERFFFYAEEMDLCKRFIENGGKVIYYPETSIVHLKGVTSSRNLWFLHKNRSIATIKFMQKHFGPIKSILGILIHFIGILIRIPILFFGGLIKFDKKMFTLSFIYMRLLFIYPKNLFN